MINVYWAAPLFNDGDCAFNRVMKAGVEACGNIAVLLPQDAHIDFSDDGWQRKVFLDNAIHIEACDVVCAVLDGCMVDDGTAWEVGYAYGIVKPVVGIHTDIRSVGVEGRVNLMIEEACWKVISSNSLPMDIDDMCARIFHAVTDVRWEYTGL